jgi:hypothetical protein
MGPRGKGLKAHSKVGRVRERIILEMENKKVEKYKERVSL